MGVAAADYDNDGFPDLFVTAYGRPILYHNNGNGTFTDVSEKAGLGAKVFEGHWTTSAVWFDFDNDGRLDLFVCSFVDYGTESHFSCGDNKLGRKFYCIPRVFKPTASLLFHNNGDGTFTEVGRGHRYREGPGEGPRRGRHRHQQRRPHGPVRRQRHRAELPLRESRSRRQGQDAVGRDCALPPKSASARMAAPAPAWAWMPPISTATAGRISSSPTWTRRCFRSTRTIKDETFRDVAFKNRGGAGHTPLERLGAAISSTTITTARSTSSWPTATPTT